MNIRKNPMKYYIFLFTILAILIIIGVLFIKPQVGVADQGDFDRIMSTSGLKLLDSDVNNPNFCRFLNYIVTDYQIYHIKKLVLTIFGSSLGHLIILITTICKWLGQTIFKTQYLAIVYSIIYILTFTIILKSLNIKNNIKFIIISLLILIIFFDGNYLIWFNSLYGEPMMFITLSLFIASVLNYIYYKYTLKKNKNIILKILFILISAFLFIGSKLQVLTALPFILFLIIKIIRENKSVLNRTSLFTLYILVIIIIGYAIGISYHSYSLNRDTQYNSVFYGILKNSENPKQDLIDLGLNPDMAVDSGKTAYLDKDKYVKYYPKSELTTNEFYKNISNFKIAKFYLTHPLRLLKGMEYTAGKSLHTSTFLGKYSEDYSKTPISEFHRFTFWSSLRENMLPQNLFFIISVYVVILIYSIYKYIKHNSNLEIKSKILLLWTIMIIGVLQFPMSFVGNGEADTSKQLFLFNFIFDGLLIFIASHILFKITDIFNFKSN